MYIIRTSWGYAVYKGSILQIEFETEIEAMQYIAAQKANQ